MELKKRGKRRRETQIEGATNKEETRKDEMREISERIDTMVAVRRRGEVDARSVRGQKEIMTIAEETRELNPGQPRKRECRGGETRKRTRERGDPIGEERARRGTKVRERRGGREE